MTKIRTVDLRQPIDIERLLIWTYRDQQADRVIGMGMGLYEQEAAMDGKVRYATSTDGVVTIERIGILGTRVDGGGPSAATLHPDAEIVHEAVSALPRDAALLVMQHARDASRPDHVTIPKPLPLPKLNLRGKPCIECASWDKGRNYGACLLEWTVEPITAEVVQLEYVTWRRTLVVLALALSSDGRLSRHRALRPSAPINPRLLSA